MAALLFGILLLVAAGLSVVLGVGWLAIIPLLVALVAIVWGGLVVSAGRTPGDQVRRTRKAELLGPGGPDDPTQGSG